MDRATQTRALLAALQALIDAVKVAGPHGAPGGVMYAALMDKISLPQFEQCMSALVTAGKLRKSGELYHFVADL